MPLHFWSLTLSWRTDSPTMWQRREHAVSLPHARAEFSNTMTDINSSISRIFLMNNLKWYSVFFLQNISRNLTMIKNSFYCKSSYCSFKELERKFFTATTENILRKTVFFSPVCLIKYSYYFPSIKYII